MRYRQDMYERDRYKGAEDVASCIGACHCLLFILGIIWTVQGANQLSYVAENPPPETPHLILHATRRAA